MQAAITKQEKHIVEALEKLNINESKQEISESLKEKEQDLVQQITQVTDVMIDEINKLILFLRKDKPLADKYFQIKFEQKSDQWHEERKVRLTGSNFKVYIHSQPATRIKNPYATFHKETKEIHSKAMDYGIKYEDVARDQYVKLHPHYVVKEATLTIRTSEPWIGASPDSLVFDQQDKLIGGIEIKCPFSKKDMTVQQAMKIPDFYLKEGVDKKVTLDQKHAYYYQVQGQMMVLDLPWVDFVVRTQKSIKVVKVERNQTFIEYLRKELKRYYFENYIWEVLKQYARSKYLDDKTKYWMSKEKAEQLVSKLAKV